MSSVNAAAKVLIVDDDPLIAQMLRPYLDEERFLTLTAPSAEAALPIMERNRPDVILLDLTMPGKSGLDLLKSVRRRDGTFVIVLTGRASEFDRVLGLELGADDYVTKPFSPREVVSRVKAVLRRHTGVPARDEERAGVPQRIVAGDLCIDLRERLVSAGGVDVALTPTEFRILEVMAASPGRAFSRAELLDRVKSESLDIGERTLDSHIAHLRQKLERGQSSARYILTVFGFGYKFNKNLDATPLSGSA